MAGRLPVQRHPPSVEALERALRPVMRRGLPVADDLDDVALLGLRGVVARSVAPDERLSRVKALNELLGRLLTHATDDVLGEAARILFGLTPGTRGTTLTQRRAAAARLVNREADHFRKHIEPKIVRALAWQLHSDSQNYTPRSQTAPPPLEVSGDTPYIAAGDVASKDKVEHEEALSRLWAAVYQLRAEILRVERLKQWPYDATEPQLSREAFDVAVAARDASVSSVQGLVQRYVDRYGQAVASGEAEFNAEGLMRLVGWKA